MRTNIDRIERADGTSKGKGRKMNEMQTIDQVKAAILAEANKRLLKHLLETRRLALAETEHEIGDTQRVLHDLEGRAAVQRLEVEAIISLAEER